MISSETMSHLHVLSRMKWGLLLLWLLLAGGLYIGLRSLGLDEAMRQEVEGLNTLVLLIGSIYAVMLAFTVFVIWGQFNEVENLVIQEANGLGDLVQFGEFFEAGFQDLRWALREYVQAVLSREWPSLADGKIDTHAEVAFKDLVNAVVTRIIPREDATQRQVYRQLLSALERVSQSRDQRVAKSLTRIPQTLATLVNTMALTLVALVLVYPFRHPVGGFCLFVLLTFLLYLANHVMMDTDNPLKGTWNVSPQPFKAVYEKVR